MNKPIFYDTCSLLLAQKSVLKNFFYISYITIQELENIKSSKDKDEAVKSATRSIIKMLEARPNSYKVVFPQFLNITEEKYNSLSNDEKIIICYIEQVKTIDNLVFCTNDLSCSLIAKYLYNIPDIQIISYQDIEDYKGYKVISTIDDIDLAYFYEHRGENIYNLLENEYLYLPTTDEVYVWRNGQHSKVFPQSFKS